MVWGRFSFMGTRVGNRAPEVWGIFKQGGLERWSTAKTTSVLRKFGLSYRRTDMLADIRRYDSIARVREGDVEKQNKVLDFLEKKIEPFRKAKGLTGDQAWKQRHDWEKKRYKDLEEAEEREADADKYDWEEEYP